MKKPYSSHPILSKDEIDVLVKGFPIDIGQRINPEIFSNKNYKLLFINGSIQPTKET